MDKYALWCSPCQRIPYTDKSVVTCTDCMQSWEWLSIGLFLVHWSSTCNTFYLSDFLPSLSNLSSKPYPIWDRCKNVSVSWAQCVMFNKSLKVCGVSVPAFYTIVRWNASGSRDFESTSDRLGIARRLGDPWLFCYRPWVNILWFISIHFIITGFIDMKNCEQERLTSSGNPQEIWSWINEITL